MLRPWHGRTPPTRRLRGPPTRPNRTFRAGNPPFQPFSLHGYPFRRVRDRRAARRPRRGRAPPNTCHYTVDKGHVEVLRWARENDAGWTLPTRDKATELGYTDDFGNLVDEWGEPIQSDDEHGESSDEE